MFTLLDAEKSRIVSFISKQLSNSKNELEARMFPPIPGQPECIDYYQFNRILRRFTYPKEKGGYGLKKDFVTQLNVTSERIPDIRESVKGEDSVKLYWLTGDAKMVQKHSPDNVYQMLKRKKDFVNLTNYPVRICISEEQMTEDDNFKLLNDLEFPKEYRLQNRISVYTEDNMFRIDFTSVKFGSGKTFKQSNVINAFPCHEIEIELIGNSQGVKLNKEDIFIKFIKNVGLILSIYYDTSILLTNTLKKEVLDNYKLLISTDEKLKKSNRKGVPKNKNKKLYTSKDFITAKPVTLHRDNIRKTKGIPNVLRNYGVTYKADGMNMLLYIIPKDTLVELNAGTDNVFLIDSNFNVMATGLSISGWDNSIIEGEYIRDGQMFCIYDMLYAKNLDIRNKPLESFNTEQTSRLTYMKDFMKDLNESDTKNASVKITEKQYLFGNDKEIFLKCKQLWDNRMGLPFHVDGLIFAPATEPYPNKAGTWVRLFKWKPPNLNSIDVLIETVKGPNKKDKLFPYVQVFDDDEAKMDPNSVTQFKKLRLYSTGSSDKFNRRTGKMIRQPYQKLFKEIDVPVNITGQIISKDPLTGLSVEITDDTIVEMSYDENKRFSWTPIRVRHEKTTRYRKYNDNFGNSYPVVLDIWKSIINPVTDKMITTGEIPPESENKVETVKKDETPYAIIENKQERLPYQNFHTAYVKKKLLKMVALSPMDDDRGSGNLIDFGVCKGGDLNRWKELGYKKVVGIDSDIKCIEEAINRYENALDNRFNITFLCGDLSKLIFPKQEAACELTDSAGGVVDWKDLMKKSISQKYIFDVVSSQFVIHYFFSDELSLRTYLQNVTDNLRIGGSFVGTTFDGSKIYDFLKRKTQEVGLKGDQTIWKITKLYDKKKFTEGRPNWGMAIDVFVNTIGYSHKEYLVSFKYLEKIALEYGLELEKIISFSEMWMEGKENTEGYNSKIVSDIRSMSDIEKKFSFLSSGFIFKKVKNAPDSTYKKIISLQKALSKKVITEK